MDPKGRDWFVVIDRDHVCMLRLDPSPESDDLNAAVQGPLAFRDGPALADGTQMAIVLNDEGANMFGPTRRVGGNEWIGAPHIPNNPWPWVFGRTVIGRYADGRLCGYTEPEAHAIMRQQAYGDLLDVELLADALARHLRRNGHDLPVRFHSWGDGPLAADLVALAGDDPILFPETR